MYKALLDWNADGTIDQLDYLIEMHQMQEMKNTWNRDERINKMVSAINRSNCEVIDNQAFMELCDIIGIPFSEYTEADIEEISKRIY